MDEITDEIEDVVKSEYHQLMRLYDRTDDLKALLDIMSPDKLVGLVQNASEKYQQSG